MVAPKLLLSDTWTPFFNLELSSPLSNSALLAIILLFALLGFFLPYQQYNFLSALFYCTSVISAHDPEGSALAAFAAKLPAAHLIQIPFSYTDPTFLLPYSICFHTFHQKNNILLPAAWHDLP